MIAGLYNRQRPMEEPHTFAAHEKACQQAAVKRQTPSMHVLAKRGPIVYCAKLVRPYSIPNGGPDCWTVDAFWPEVARLTILVKNVIACNPEFCSCLAASSAVNASASAARLVGGEA